MGDFSILPNLFIYLKIRRNRHNAPVITRIRFFKISKDKEYLNDSINHLHNSFTAVGTREKEEETDSSTKHKRLFYVSGSCSRFC